MRDDDQVLNSFNPLPSPKQGETALRKILGLFGMFQSAPLTEARGDAGGRRLDALNALFQSAPLTEARGDLSQWRPWLAFYEFQSAPLTEARGDRFGVAAATCLTTSFNPLPSPKQGETLAAVDLTRSMRCFNPLPSPKQGETGSGWQQLPVSQRVSIRSPHRSKGRHSTERGAAYGLSCFNPLPSPKQGETPNPRPVHRV